jgi:hypothetical protein
MKNLFIEVSFKDYLDNIRPENLEQKYCNLTKLMNNNILLISWK